ncbi:lipocalin domain-containing protein [Aliarcobacter faecis]|uniref:lipocalin family protein n=1 Tax=Aliarcobacter faecis TaxID=1564138 RepID=UPI00047C6316|nr:lipocalin family protein [Aliarcobacter faecis]QKF73132.1 lipocalin domain-containing protein [Aliarcobacter faecis]
MKIFSLFGVVFLSLFFTSCSTKQTDLKTVEKVDLERYLGTWYEIARYEHSFQKDCKNVKANYSLREDKKIQVVNSCTKISTNEFKDAKAIAYSVDETNSKLKVSFFRPFYGDYWILDLDKDYKYVIIGTPSKEYLWILSREKIMNDELLNKLLEKITSLGFDKSKLIYTIQE